MLQVKPITDLSKWDELVESSPQGTIFSTSKWLSLWDNNVVYGVYRGNELIGGIAGFVKDGQFLSGATPLTPFQGTIIMPTEGKWITRLGFQEEVISTIANHLKKATVYNHYNLPSIRPYQWAGWKPCGIKYTYILELNDSLKNELSKDTKYEIYHTDAEMQIGTMRDFAPIYEITFKRKNLEPPVGREWLDRFYEIIKPDIWLAVKENKILAGVCIMYDSKRAYYIFGASTGENASAFCLWNAMQEIKRPELDMVGCNDQKIDCFKRGFGGILKVYHGVFNV